MEKVTRAPGIDAITRAARRRAGLMWPCIGVVTNRKCGVAEDLSIELRFWRDGVVLWRRI